MAKEQKIAVAEPTVPVNTAQHQQVWNSAKVTRKYGTVDQLQVPEQAIIDRLGDAMSNMRMLDIGIGGGRTTLHFAGRVAGYLGVDYAPSMINACQVRFPDPGPHVRFAVMDATNMPELPDHSFDLVLFSFNGLDCVAPEERDKVLHEVLRVGRPNGYFAFSSHNIQYIPRMYALKWHRRWRDFLYQFYRSARLYYQNGSPERYRNSELAVIYDGVEHFTLATCYIRPEHQIQRLKELGFRDIKALSLSTGLEVPPEQLPQLTQEAWIYYLCRM